MPHNDIAYPLFKASKKNNLAKVNALRSRVDDMQSIYRDHLGQNALHVAIINNNPDLAFTLVSMQPELLNHARSNDDATPLVLAASLNRWSCLQAMLRAKDCNHALEDEQNIDMTLSGSALLIAVKKQKKAIVKQLIDFGAPTNRQDFPLGNSALIYAVRANDANLVTLLRNNQASESLNNFHQESPFSEALRLCHWDALIALCLTGGKFEQALCKKALIKAIIYGQYSVVKALLMHTDINPNDIIDNDDSINTPLHLAVIYDHPEIAALLIQHKATCENHFDKNGDTALHLAIRQTKSNMILWLKSLGFEPISLKSSKGISATNFAQTLSINLEPQKSAELTKVVSEQNPIHPIILAIAKGSKESLAQLLSEDNSNLSNITTVTGLTLLEYTISLGASDLLSSLLEKFPADEQDNAFQYACTHKQWTCAEVIKPIEGLVARIDEQHYHHLSWYSRNIKKEKNAFITDLQSSMEHITERGEKEKFYRCAAQSKTAKYHALFWRKSETRTTIELSEAANKLSLSSH